MKRVLLTGGGGAIGVHVIAHLMTETDWEVVVLDSFRHKGWKDRILTVCRDQPQWNERVRIIQHDICCPIGDPLKKAIGPIDYVLHLAALSDVFFSVENPVYVVKNNVDSTLVMLEYARETSPEVFLYFSTDEVYGPVPHHEAHPEWDTHRPSNAYAASKAASEDICYSWWRSYDVPLIITNTMNNFGEMQAPSKFPAMVQRKLQRGEKVIVHGTPTEIGSRFYIHSRNTADALLYILRNLPPHRHALGELDEPDRYHIVGDVNWDNLELAQLIAELMGRELDYELVDFHHDNPAHDIHYGLQDNKLRRSGWSMPVSSLDSLRNTIKWQQENPEWL